MLVVNCSLVIALLEVLFKKSKVEEFNQKKKLSKRISNFN